MFKQYQRCTMNHFLYFQFWRLHTVQNLQFLANNSKFQTKPKKQKTALQLIQERFAQDSL